LHRHRYHGVLAPNAPLRAAVTALARAAGSHPASTEPLGSEGLSRSPARTLWAILIARIYETSPLSCPQGGTEMRIIAFVTDTGSVTRILQHLGEPAKPPRLSPARGPPAGEATFHQTPVFDPVAPASAGDFEFDQSVTW